MNRVVVFLASGVVLSASLLMSAQTKPAATPAPTAAQTVKPAAMTQPVQPAQPASPAPTTSAASRTAVGGLGVGNFLWPGGWNLTSYGCFRTDTRLFCDFDTSNPNNQQVNSSIWSGGGGVNLVDDGGKITGRHNAFFVGTDGSQFQTAYISQQPVRFIIEYDDVNPSYNTVSLVLANSRIQRVPVTQIDPSQPVGTIPARTALAAAPAGTAAPSGTAAQAGTSAANTANGASNTAQQAVDKAKATKKKWTDVLNSVTK